jgi:membrane protease YdiL (CAAX protease family)
MNIKSTLHNLSPFNHETNMHPAAYAVKKMLAFFFVYMAAAVIFEIIIIAGLTAMGYDPTHGVMPAGHVAELLQYYGFAGFGLATILYCVIVEKRNLRSLGFNGKVFDYLTGAVLAIALLAVIVGAGLAAGVLRFDGMIPSANIPYLAILFGAFVVQSLAEEILSRGFLLPSLAKKTPLPVAILVSSTAFALPHLASVVEAEGAFAVIGVANLYLVSLVFSLLFLLRSNIYIVAGLHCVWNFVLYGVMGLAVSGSEANPDALMAFEVTGENLLSGGIYGLEASIVTTAVLGIVSVILVTLYRKRGMKHGI